MSNPAPHLVEKTRNLIMAALKANIATTLNDVRVDRADPSVTTEPPKSYFIYETNLTYQCPAIFVVVDSGELPEEQTGANHINGVMRIFVSAAIEDQDAERLTIKAERYQSALFEILHWATLQDDPKNVKIWVRVARFEFSPLYTKKRGDNMSDFRKEVSLELVVNHYENPN